jgi:cytochrome o ubiquinol oxidase operon protein cyoD
LSAPHTDTHAHSTGRGYLIGTLLSIVLTVIPFWLVMTGTLAASTTIAAIVLLAVVQIVVQVYYFLHLDTRSEGGWNLIAFLFTAVIVVIAVGGSIWVMYHLNANMMPMPDGTMQSMKMG